MEILGDALSSGRSGDGDPLFALDPRFRMAIFALFVFLPFFMNTLAGLGAVLAYSTVYHLVSGLPARIIFNSSRRFFFLVLLVFVVNTLLARGEPISLKFPFSLLSKEGIRSGAFYGTRILILYLAALTFASSTSQEELACALSGFIKPFSRGLASRLALGGFLSVGFLPVFAEEFHRIRIVQGFRGGGFQGGVLKRMWGVRLVLVPLVLSAIHRSSQLAAVVELRGLRGAVERIGSLPKPPARDCVRFGVAVCVLASSFLW